MSVSGSYQHQKLVPLLANSIFMKAPAAAAANLLRAATNITNLSQSFTPTTQPAQPRNVVLTLVDTTPSITGGTITVVGLDQNGKHISEQHTVTGAGTYTGNVAFSRVNSVDCALTGALTSPGDETLAIGGGTKLGLPVGIDAVLEEVFLAKHNNAAEAVGTVNKTYATIVPTAASDGTNDKEFWYSYRPKISTH